MLFRSGCNLHMGAVTPSGGDIFNHIAGRRLIAVGATAGLVTIVLTGVATAHDPAPVRETPSTTSALTDDEKNQPAAPEPVSTATPSLEEMRARLNPTNNPSTTVSLNEDGTFTVEVRRLAAAGVEVLPPPPGGYDTLQGTPGLQSP